MSFSQVIETAKAAAAERDALNEAARQAAIAEEARQRIDHAKVFWKAFFLEDLTDEQISDNGRKIEAFATTTLTLKFHDHIFDNIHRDGLSRMSVCETCGMMRETYIAHDLDDFVTLVYTPQYRYHECLREVVSPEESVADVQTRTDTVVNATAFAKDLVSKGYFMSVFQPYVVNKDVMALVVMTKPREMRF